MVHIALNNQMHWAGIASSSSFHQTSHLSPAFVVRLIWWTLIWLYSRSCGDQGDLTGCSTCRLILCFCSLWRYSYVKHSYEDNKYHKWNVFCSSVIEILSRSSVDLIYTFDIKVHCSQEEILLCNDVVVVPQSKAFKDDGYVFFYYFCSWLQTLLLNR